MHTRGCCPTDSIHIEIVQTAAERCVGLMSMCPQSSWHHSNSYTWTIKIFDHKLHYKENHDRQMPDASSMNASSSLEESHDRRSVMTRNAENKLKVNGADNYCFIVALECRTIAGEYLPKIRQVIVEKLYKDRKAYDGLDETSILSQVRPDIDPRNSQQSQTCL